MRKRGFTLIELIAVVVVIGIIAVVSVPAVANQIDKARKEAYGASVRGLFDSVNSYLASNDVTGYLSATGVYIPSDEVYKKLDLKNDIFTSGRIYLDSDQVLHAQNVSDGNFCANGTKSDLEIIKGSCDLLDVTAPEIEIYVSRTTSSSITIVVNSSDDESGITTYRYYLNGNLIEENKNNVYTFKDLKVDTEYTIEVKTINGNNMEATKTIKAKTNSNDFVWKENPEGWSKKKTITLTYPSLTEIEVYQYKVIGTTDWITVTGNTVDIVIEKSTTITARLLKEGTVMFSKTKTFAQIDNEAPIINSVTGNDDKWTTSKKIVVDAVDTKSGLADKAYSFDGGKTWQESSSKIFASNGTIEIMVKDKLDNVTEVYSLELTKIDATIPKVHYITATISGNNYESDTWTTDNVVLKANQNPATTISGYTYQWYKKSGSTYEVVSGATNDTLILQNEGIGVYKVRITTGAGASRDSEEDFIVKIDKTEPKTSLTGTIYTNKAVLTATCSDNVSEITKYEFSKDGGNTWNDNGTTKTYTYTGLTQTTSYNFKVRCTNAVGLTNIGTFAKTTGTIVAPTWGITPTGYTSGNKVAKVTYIATGIATPIYFLKGTTTGTTNVALVACSTASNKTPKSASECTGTTIAANKTVTADTWYMVKSGTTVSMTVSTNGSWVAVTSDGTNTKTSSSATVAGIDKTAPSASLTGTMYTNRAVLAATCVDNESGITKYEFSKDGGSTWNDNGTTNTYIYTGLTQTTSYNFKVRCTNGSKLTTIGSLSTQTGTITTPTWGITPTGYTSGSKVATVTYSSTNVATPVYFLKGTTPGTTNVALVTCSTLSTKTPKSASECTGATIAANGTVKANTWYMVKSGTTVSMTVSTNGSWVAVISDGTNTKTSSSATVVGIDKTAPSASLTGTMYTNKAELTATCIDNESGITKYEFSKDGGSTWNNNGTTNTYTYTELTQTTSYNFKVRCTNGSKLTTVGSLSTQTTTISTPTWGITPTGYINENKVAKVTYIGTGIETPIYFLKGTTSGTTDVALVTCSTASNKTPKAASECTGATIAANGTVKTNTWYMLKSGTTASITVSTNGSWVAVTSDGTNTKTSSSATVVGIDKTAPSASLTGTMYTNRAVLTATCIDNESGITKYEFSRDDGTTWDDNGTTNTYTYTELTQTTLYTFKVRCTNGSKLTTTGSLSKQTATIVTPTWGITPTGYTNGNKVATVTYSSTNVATPVYFLKGTTPGTTNVALVTCSTLSTKTPKSASECTGTTIAENKAVVANTWYMVKSGTTVSMTVSTNGSWVAVTSDGTNTKTSSSATVAGIDKTAPTVSFSISGTTYGSGYQSGAKVTVTCSDSESGIASGSKTQTLTSAGTNTVSTTCKDNAGNTTTDSRSYTIYVYSANAACGNKTCATAACGVSSYKSCATADCGCKTYSCTLYKKCATSGCGVSSYKTCATEACGVSSYKTCATADCGCKTYKQSGSKCGWTSSLECIDKCGATTDIYKCSCSSGANKCAMGTGTMCTISIGKRCSAAGCQTYNTCADDACGVSSYKTCTHADCGANYNTCRNSACGTETVTGSSCNNAKSKYCSTYKTCADDACGVSSYKTCSHKDCGYLTCWHT